MSQKERNKAVIAKAKSNISAENTVMMGSLEVQSRWCNWSESVLRMDLSWQRMFQYGESLLGFCLSSVYGNIVTPGRAALWTPGEEGNCKLCDRERGTIQHILSGCKVALNQGRYTWRHNKVLRKISDHVRYHVENRVNKYGASTNRAPPIAFVRTGEGNKGNLKRSYKLEAGVLSGAKDWVVTTD